MKYLVLALCVCAASAASFGNFGTGAASPYQYKPFVPTRTAAKAVVQVISPVSSPVVQAAKFVSPVAVAPVQVAPVQIAPVPVAPVPVVPAVKTYNNYVSEAGAQVVRNENEVVPEGFRYYYETDNGIVAESTGTLKTVGDSPALVVQGSYKYYAQDGTPVSFTYIADENGYQPQSDLLPVAPPVPEPILRSLQYIASRSAAKNIKEY